MSAGDPALARRLLTVTALMAAFATAEVAPAAVPGENGRLSYVTNGKLMTINPDGSGREVVFDLREGGETPMGTFGPSYAPDGQTIALDLLFEDGDGHLLGGGIGLSDTATGTLDIHTRDWGVHPDFSPDGESLVYNAPRDEKTWSTWQRDLATGHRTALPARGDDPTYSADGRYVVFAGNYRDPIGIFKLDLRDGSVVQLADGWAAEPDVSPDGTQVVFTRRPPYDSETHLFTVGMDGTGERQLTFNETPDDEMHLERSPSYSPDGKHIVYSVSNWGHPETDGLRIIPSDGGTPVRVPNTYPGYAPDWGVNAGVHRPEIRVESRQRLRGNETAAGVRVGAGEPVTVRARAWARIRAGLIVLRSKTRSVPGGGLRNLKLRPSNALHERRLRRALEAGGALEFRLGVELVDDAGAKARRRAKLTLRN